MTKATPGYCDFTNVEVADHLNYLFNGTRGYIVVAVLNRDRKTSLEHKIGPTQRYFSWPQDEESVVSYITSRMRREWHEVWLCPYPFRTPDRKQGNSSVRRIVHADVDTPLTDGLRATVRALGFRVVSTGTPGHVQVYARLTRGLSVDEHRAIEDALRVRLRADAKISDNDYTKVPGTTNYKNHRYVEEHKRNDRPYPVTVECAGRVVDVARLCRWLNVDLSKATPARTPVRSGGWAPVHVPLRGQPVWVQALADEQPDGDRSRRCYAVVRGLADLNQYTDDQIHTLLHDYAPGVDKYGSRWHDEIHRILSADKTKDIEKFDVIENFWTRRPVLAHIHRVALASYAGPWGTLGVALMRALHVVPPRVVLPDLGGGIRSLNLFVALVAKSGGGKDTAIRAGTNAIDVGTVVRPLNLGSGEGIAKSYRYRGKDGAVAIKANAVMFDAGEISSWNALLSRTGSTLLGELLKGFAGGGLGFQNADDTKAIPVDADTYRMSLMVSAQPAKSTVLFSESGSGLPQRFLYLPLGNPDHPDDVEDVPTPFVWEVPEFPGDAEVPIGVCDAVRAELRERNRLRVREELREDPLDSHWPVIKLRVAVAFALLDGRTDVTDDDWDLSGIVMNVSRLCRDSIVSELRTERLRMNRERGKAEGERVVAAREVVEEDAIDRCEQAVLRVLTKASSNGQWVSSAAIRRAVRADIRSGLTAALARLVKSGAVRKTQRTYQGQKGYVFSIASK